jgi:alginate O-acetyltransferase complex protein AlgI
MLFTSQIFFLLLSITFILYYLPFVRKYQIYILIFSSLIFYAYFKPILLLLLLASIFLNTIGSYYIYYSTSTHRKSILAICVTLNLAILAFFKYTPLFSRTFFDANSSIGLFLLTIPLPIGISFFTFEGISLLIDTIRNNHTNKDIHDFKVKKKFYEHFLDVFLFVSFFPHLISGPILKAYQFLPQIGTKLFKEINWDRCIKLLITGYFLKMVIADNLKEQTTYLNFPNFLNVPSPVLIAMVFGYSMQIFADFAGYSLIALGLGALFGYTLNINFNFPYISATFSEFWQRWHISLSTFLKEYLYYPLGGNRKGKLRTYLNLFIVMFLGGLWHGAAWSYAIWGTFHGVALAIERLLADFGLKIKPTRLYLVFKIFLVFFFVTFSWLLFKLPNISYVGKYLTCITTNFIVQMNNFWIRVIIFVIIYSIPVILYHLYYLYKQNNKINRFERFEYLVYGIMMFLIFTNSGISGDFIYFQF